MRAALEHAMHEVWSHRGLTASLLYPFSLIYLAVARAKARKTVPVELPVPVVVVGNIYVGGTGKTPITIELVRELRTAGFTPGVISRGYGRASNELHLVEEEPPAGEVGDEPLLIRRATGVPVAVGRDRVAAGRLLIEKNPQVNVIVSDDGLQHRRLARDVELAVVGARGLGNGWTLPAGPLRELPSRLDEVDAIVLSANEDEVDSRTPRFAATSQLGDVVRLADGTRRSIEDIAHRIAEKEATVLAAAGIAAPERFFDMLTAHDIEGKTLALGDHFDYVTNPFAQRSERYIFITAKDAVKAVQNPQIKNDRRIWVVEYQTQLDPYLVQFVVDKLTQAAERKHIDIVPPTEQITH